MASAIASNIKKHSRRLSLFFRPKRFHVTYAKKGKFGLAIEPTCQYHRCSNILHAQYNSFNCIFLWDTSDKFVVFSRRHVQHVLEIGKVLYGLAFVRKQCNQKTFGGLSMGFVMLFEYDYILPFQYLYIIYIYIYIYSVSSYCIILYKILIV